jgi:hypothetical protein
MSETDTPTADGLLAPSEVSDTDLQQFVAALRLDRIAPGRISRLLLFQLYCCAHVPAIAARLGDVAKIDAELRGLEGTFGRSTGTRPAEPFARLPLKGLWKKHYLVGGRRSFAMNVRLGGGKKGREFRRIVASRHNPDTNHLPPQEVAGHIAHDVVQLYADRARAQELTGEWIVFAKHEKKTTTCVLPRMTRATTMSLLVSGTVAPMNFRSWVICSIFEIRAERCADCARQIQLCNQLVTT